MSTRFAQALKPQWKAKATSLLPREIGCMASTKMWKWVLLTPKWQRRRHCMKTRSHPISRSMSTGIKQTPSITISRSLALLLFLKMKTYTSFQIPTNFSVMETHCCGKNDHRPLVSPRSNYSDEISGFCLSPPF